MKNILIAGILAAVSFGAQAQLPEDACLMVNEASSVIMEVRQAGVPAYQAVAAAKGDEFLIYFLQEAYKEPIQVTEELKNQAIVDFASSKYLECLRLTSI